MNWRRLALDVLIAIAMCAGIVAWTSVDATEPDPDAGEPVAGEIITMRPGEWIRCMHPEGCVAFTRPVANEFLRAANAGRSCARSI